MSTPSAKPKSVEIFSHHVAAGPRSFFFNVKRAPRGELFITIHELTAKDNSWTSSRILVPAEDMKEFYMGMCEAIRAMRKAEAEFPQPEPEPAKVSAQPKRVAEDAPAIPKANRATGRARQAANRQAILATAR